MLDIIAQGICLGGVYALVALGISIVFQSSTVLNLTYGAQILILAYLLHWFLTAIGMPLWASMLLVFILGVVLSMLVERVFIRPIQGRSLLSIIMVTLMAAVLVRAVAILIWGGQSYSYPFTPSGFLSLGSMRVLPAYAYALAGAIMVFVILFLFFRYTKVGLGMRVVAANMVVAQSLGLRVRRLISISWVASGLFSALCAILIGMVSMVTPDMDHLVLAKGFPVLLLGGIASIPGALVGGLIIGVAETLGGHFATGWGVVVPWLMMLVILLVRPWGLFGKQTVQRI